MEGTQKYVSRVQLIQGPPLLSFHRSLESIFCPPGYEEHLKNQNAMFLLHEKKRQRELNFEYQNKSQ